MHTPTSLRAAGLGCLAGLALSAMVSVAHAQLKPYILVVVDTSGSMGPDMMNPVTNSCGYADMSKMAAAKCALSRIQYFPSTELYLQLVIIIL